MATNGIVKKLGSDGPTIIPFDGLEPKWTTPGATEGGFLRWLISWVGGPKGYVNPSLGQSLISENICVGYMKLLAGNRQKGLHTHSIVEIYLVLRGELEGYDGLGHIHRAGPMDLIYIPVGVPHAVRATTLEDVELIWIHDGVEVKGTSIYYWDPETVPKVGGIDVLRFNDMHPSWEAPKAKQSPFLRWVVNFVGGKEGFINHDRDHAIVSEKVALGVEVILSGSGQVRHSLPGAAQCYVLLQGSVTVEAADHHGASSTLKRLDALWVPGGAVHALKNVGQESAVVFWCYERPQKEGSVVYELE
ncbi:hypothetical protein Z517_01554 [Fonsecaea pedrosoi CBS 271.37]|uniref:Cupin type-2 domain-containing protein n=1 Tax=Fonsecaea pedrosoi CBS 271.37 TaxID=1442368 RepID=A0A0D2HNW5_9EURO|nr:uncharacterized protein Z517_01554 [Fonsecaea pedrosoi CBS 271.37]KIW86159.1 hypothetical protein Z517_01554 [Fonsecaea pedrosoi CBS 271.37]